MLQILFVGILLSLGMFGGEHGIPEITHHLSAKDRKDAYLSQANMQPSSRSTFFRIIEANLLKDDQSLKLLDTCGPRIEDARKKLLYSCNQQTDEDSNLPRRSELFRLNGVEKGKYYLASGDGANGRAKTIEADRDTGRSASGEHAGVWE